MNPSTRLFLQRVSEHTARGLSHDAAWQLTKMQNPTLVAEMTGPTPQTSRTSALSTAARTFLRAVNDRQSHLGGTFDESWQAISATRPDLLAAMNAAPANSSVSPDGSQLLPNGRPSPEKLHQMGLPQLATEEAIRLYLAADRAEKLTPEQAASTIKTLVQSHQLRNALSFDDAMNHVKEHFPDLFNSARNTEGLH